MEIAEFTKRIVPMRRELLGIAVKLTGNGDTAEDLVQEVMLKLWSIRGDLDRHTNHKALAMTILRNKYNDYWRHRQMETEEKPLHGDIQAEPDGMDARDEVALVKEIVKALPPLQARIFRLKEIEGYDKEEIMQITGCTPESLRQNLSRARKRIREEFIKRVKG